MLRKTMKKRLFCQSDLIPIAIVVMFCIAGYGMSQGINVPIQTMVLMLLVKEHAIQVMSENYLGDLFQVESSETGNSSKTRCKVWYSYCLETKQWP